MSPSITPEQALQALRQYAATVAGVSLATVRTGDADSMMPNSPSVPRFYVIRALTEDEAQGPPAVVYGLDDGDLVAQVQEWRALAFQLDGFGAGADDGLRAVARRYVSGVPAGDALRAAGVHLFRLSPITDMSRLLQTGTMPRWTMTLDASIAYVEAAYPVDALTSAVVDVTLERPNEVVASFSVTVEP